MSGSDHIGDANNMVGKPATPTCPDCGDPFLDLATIGTYVQIPCACDYIEDSYVDYSNIE